VSKIPNRSTASIRNPEAAHDGLDLNQVICDQPRRLGSDVFDRPSLTATSLHSGAANKGRAIETRSGGDSGVVAYQAN
jgi:hypothetical protein